MNGARGLVEKNRLFIFFLLFSPTWREREERWIVQEVQL